MTPQLLNLRLSYGLVPKINIPTRVSRTSTKLLANIFCNVPFRSSGVVVNVEFDHFSAFAEFDVFTHKQVISDLSERAVNFDQNLS